MSLAADAAKEAHARPPHTAWGRDLVSSSSRKIRRGFCPVTTLGGSLGAAQRPRPLPLGCSREKAQRDSLSSSAQLLGLRPSLPPPS